MDDSSVPPSPPPHTETDSATVESKIPSHPSPIVKKRVTSEVWNYFTKTGMQDGKPMCMCKGCGQSFTGGCFSWHITFKASQTCLSQITRCKHWRYRTLFDEHASKIQVRQRNQKTIRDMIAEMIVRHDLPFMFAEYPGFQKLLNYLNPDGKSISRNTVSSDVGKLYSNRKLILKGKLSKIPSRVCLTSDMWTSCTMEGYLSLTAHYVDENCNLNNKIIAFSHLPPPHTGSLMSKRVMDILKDWGIEKKIFSITLDNASSNFLLQEHLKDKLNVHNSLLSKGEFFHVRCCAHILNLIVQEGLKVAKNALSKIRESIRWIKASEARMIKFKECAKGLNIVDGVHLRIDMPTRWNSTFMMLESAIKYKVVFSVYEMEEEGYKECPSKLEWERAERMCQFLRPFYDITNMMSGSTYPTSNLYFWQIWKIEKLLIENSNNEDEVIREMTIGMKAKFDKYWSDYSVVLAIAAVLDPRFKLAILEVLFKVVEPDYYYSKIHVVRTKIFQLYHEYSNNPKDINAFSSNKGRTPSTSTSSMNQEWTSEYGGFIDIDELKGYEAEIISHVGKSQLELYLEEPKLEVAHHSDLDVLRWWKENKARFPDLSRMAFDILSIPITTVASESAFSIGSRVLNKYRSCLLPSKVEAIMCTRNWLFGFDPDPEVEDDDKDKEKTTSTNFDSVTSSSVLQTVVEVDDDDNDD